MLMNPKFLIKYASRSRPDNFFRGLDNITQNIQTENYEVLCSCDIDDSTMANDAVKDRMEGYPKAKMVFGTSKTKIEAINADVWMVKDWDILINFSDDMIFIKKYFDTFIFEAMQFNYPDTDGFLHFHDNCQNRLATMSIIGYKWYNRTNYIYHPSYRSEWADNEAQEVAKREGKYTYMGDKVRIFSHINPFHGNPHLLDELYVKNSTYVSADKQNYFNRLNQNFPL